MIKNPIQSGAHTQRYWCRGSAYLGDTLDLAQSLDGCEEPAAHTSIKGHRELCQEGLLVVDVDRLSYSILCHTKKLDPDIATLAAVWATPDLEQGNHRIGWNTKGDPTV